MHFLQKERIKTVNKIKETIVSADNKGLKVNKKLLIAEICVTEGAAKRKAEEYINDLINSGFCSDNNGELELSQNERNRILDSQFEFIT